MIQAVLFDLDGTLLPLDFDRFLPRYLKLLQQWFAARLPGVDVIGPVMASTQVLMKNDGGRTNEELLWGDFLPRFAVPRRELERLFLEFYREGFPTLGAGITPEPGAAALVEECRRRGLKVILATNPVFLRSVIDERVRWAGLDAVRFDLVTSLERMRYCKPHPGYFRQITEELGLEAGACLMVGNDIRMDLKPAAAVGMKTCLVHNDYQVLSEGFTPDHACPLSGVLELL
jgi:HAD superfamily hydrolase (TIGR01509 family)